MQNALNLHLVARHAVKDNVLPFGDTAVRALKLASPTTDSRELGNLLTSVNQPFYKSTAACGLSCPMYCSMWRKSSRAGAVIDSFTVGSF